MFVKWAQLPFFLVDAEDKLQCCDFSNVSDDRINDRYPISRRNPKFDGGSESVVQLWLSKEILCESRALSY